MDYQSNVIIDIVQIYSAKRVYNASQMLVLIKLIEMSPTVAVVFALLAVASAGKSILCIKYTFATVLN